MTRTVFEAATFGLWTVSQLLMPIVWEASVKKLQKLQNHVARVIINRLFYQSVLAHIHALRWSTFKELVPHPICVTSPSGSMGLHLKY